MLDKKELDAIRKRYYANYIGFMGKGRLRKMDTKALLDHIQALQEENERLEKERYLPIVCSNCGRMRICYLPGEHETWCDKCYTDFSKIAPPGR